MAATKGSPWMGPSFTWMDQDPRGPWTRCPTRPCHPPQTRETGPGRPVFDDGIGRSEGRVPDCTVFISPSVPVTAVHILDDNVENLAEGRAVLQHLPGLVCMEMDLDQFLVSDGNQAVAVKMFPEVGVDCLFVEVGPSSRFSISSWVS